MRAVLLLMIIALSLMNLSAQNLSVEDRKKAMQEEIELLQIQAIRDSLRQAQGFLPCEIDGLDTDAEYITGFGIGEPVIDPRSEAEARKNAINNAKMEIGRKWIGTIDSIVEEYYKTASDSTQNSMHLKETLKISGQRAIDGYAKVECSKCMERKQTKRTVLTCYVAVKIPVSEIAKKVVEDSRKQGQKIDKQKITKSVRNRKVELNFGISN